MIFDIILAAALIISIAAGYRSGFTYTFVHTAGWLIAVIISIIFSPQAGMMIKEKTGIYDSMNSAFYSRFSESLENGDPLTPRLPEIISGPLDDIRDNVASSLSDTTTDIVFSILCFVVLFFAVTVLLWLIAELFSKKHSGGLHGFADGLLGAFAGCIRGFVIVFFLFALLAVFSGILPPESGIKIADSLSESAFAKDFYDNNLLLLLIDSHAL